MTVRFHLDEDYLRYALRQVESGRRHSMPGIRKCPQCRSHYRNDYAETAFCPDCRTDHDRICQQCGTRFDCDRYGTRLCPCCRDQQPLF